MSILLAGKGVNAIKIPNVLVSASGATAPQRAFISFRSNGTVVYGAINGETQTANWYAVTTSGIGNEFELRAETASGTAPNGTYDTWTQISGFQDWLLESNVGLVEGAVTFLIRRIGGGTIDSRVINFSAEVIA